MIEHVLLKCKQKVPNRSSKPYCILVWTLSYRDFQEKYLDSSAENSYWVLLTKKIIPESLGKKFDAQVQLLNTRCQTAKVPYYKMPRLLEVTTNIIIDYVRTDETLYADDTRCQERDPREPSKLVNIGFDGWRLWLDLKDENGGACGLAGVRRL